MCWLRRLWRLFCVSREAMREMKRESGLALVYRKLSNIYTLIDSTRNLNDQELQVHFTKLVYIRRQTRSRTYPFGA